MFDASDFVRRVQFQPGYNYLHETGPKRRGQHGMEIAFALIGPLGSVSFELNTFWTPPGPVDEGRTEVVHFDEVGRRWGDPVVRPPSGTAVFIHWRDEFPDTLGQRDACSWLDGALCWGDVTYSGSDPILRDFIREGDAAVWRHLADWYESVAQRTDEVSGDA